MSIRNDPFEAMERMFEQMRRSGLRADPFPAAQDAAAFDANVSLEREGDDYVVFADLPGFEREELEVTYRDGTLTISGVHEDGEGETYRSRSVQESVAIPDDVRAEEIEASYRNGVLEVRLPVADTDADGYRIEIE